MTRVVLVEWFGDQAGFTDTAVPAVGEGFAPHAGTQDPWLGVVVLDAGHVEDVAQNRCAIYVHGDGLVCGIIDHSNVNPLGERDFV